MSTEVFFVLKEKCMEYRLQYVPVTSLNTHFSQSGELHFSGKKKFIGSGPLCFSVPCARGFWSEKLLRTRVQYSARKNMIDSSEWKVPVGSACEFDWPAGVMELFTPDTSIILSLARAMYTLIYSRSVEARRAQPVSDFLFVAVIFRSYIRFLAARESLKMMMARRGVCWSENNICLYYILTYIPFLVCLIMCETEERNERLNRERWSLLIFKWCPVHL